MTTYEPGTVAIATVRGVPNVRVMAGYGTAEPRLRWVTTDARLVDAENEGWWFSFQVTDIRPLVVLDLTAAGAHAHLNARQVATEAVNTLRASDWISDTNLADQIEAQTHLPKPVEPTGYLAMVEDADGEVWVRDERDQGVVNPWRQLRISDRRTQLLVGYSRINVVRVLSEGVTS